MSEAPCTLDCPRSGIKPVPGLPTCPVSSDKLVIASAPSTPVRCCVMPMPHDGVPRWPCRNKMLLCECSMLGHRTTLRRLPACSPLGSHENPAQFSVRVVVELFIRQPLIDDNVSDRVEYRNVGARTRTQPHIRMIDHLNAPRSTTTILAPLSYLAFMTALR